MKKLSKALFISIFSTTLVFISSIHTYIKAESPFQGTISGHLTSSVNFSEDQFEEVKDWYEESIEESVSEELEPALEEAQDDHNVVEETEIETVIEEVESEGIDPLFGESQENTSLVTNLPELEVNIGGIVSKTDKNGNYSISGIPAGEHLLVVSFEGSPIYTNQITISNNTQTMDIELNVSGDAFYEGAQDMMSHSVDSSETTDTSDSTDATDVVKASTTYYSTKKVGTLVGSGKGTMKIIASGNIVSCNKADNSISDSKYFPANGSDCSVAIARGTAYASNPRAFSYWSQNYVCYIETIQSAADMFFGDGGRNVYCNPKKKSGGHYNCSWFRGHSEKLHTH